MTTVVDYFCYSCLVWYKSSPTEYTLTPHTLYLDVVMEADQTELVLDFKTTFISVVRTEDVFTYKTKLLLKETMLLF